MNEEKIKEFLDEQYKLLENKGSKQRAQILFNVIKVKHKYKITNYNQSLYLDIKSFLKDYISAAEYEDFGYDKPRLEKIEDIVDLLSQRQKLFAFQAARRHFFIQGYDIDDINSLIKKQEMVVACDSRNYIKYFSLKIGSDLKSLLWGYFIYAVVTMLILLPAPFRWMAIFDIELKKYSSSPFWNYPLNTIGLLTGNESISPVVLPIGVVGLLVYSFGLILFYFLIANFLFKKLEDFISINS
ncbi:hypothetical protein ACI76O_11610 [Capnocytophaga cynodegmi]|uniref:hypothetical protein n=1 Tax=Capnocytophaga cynodegmi TaxID=28189 RepID=UPI003858635A